MFADRRAPSKLGFDQPLPRHEVVSSLPPVELRFARGPRAGQRFVLARDTITVLGRHADCDIALQDESVSARHAEIHLSHGRCVLRDTGSLTGTYLNYHPVDTVRLTDGDDVAIGLSRFTVRTHWAGRQHQTTDREPPGLPSAVRTRSPADVPRRPPPGPNAIPGSVDARAGGRVSSEPM